MNKLIDPVFHNFPPAVHPYPTPLADTNITTQNPQGILTATPSIRSNPTVKCANGNVGVLSTQDNVIKLKPNRL